jgi:hypothetical protein
MCCRCRLPSGVRLTRQASPSPVVLLTVLGVELRAAE